jgi:acid phosphatase
MRKIWLAFAGCALVGLSAGSMVAQQAVQAGQKSEFVVNAAAERLPNIDRVKSELKKYHDCTCTCGCYTRDFSSQAERGLAYLTKRAAHRRPGEKLAMVLDIDETSVTNWEEMLKADFTYDSKAFSAWESESRAPALEGTLKLYREAQKLGVSVFFITGRPEEERAVTEKNLRAQGFDGWQGLALRGAHKESQMTAEYKSVERAKIAAHGYTLVLNAGDQWSDLKGKPEAEYSVKYPNPFYYIP